jgi:hypothetical protein
MIKKEIKELIKQQVKSKVNQLSDWKKVRYEGGRLYYETLIILNEISEYSTEIKVYYLETLYKEKFIIQDNWPSEAPDITSELKNWIQTQVSQLKIKNFNSDDDFLNKKFDTVSFDKTKIEENLKQILELRMAEINDCINANANLSAVILIGSILEGLLLGYAMKFPKTFNTSPVAPKDDNGKIRTFNNWTLSDFINTAYNIGLLKEDVKNHSHTVRDFRNYIHPRQQLSTLFFPDKNTSLISLHVLKACITQLIDNEDKLK